MPISPQSDCGESDKRRMENGGGGGGGEAKRRKKEVVNGGDAEMKRVAEMVLVLSAMGKMRGGRDPTVVETTIMAEARKKVMSLCEEFSPKDIVPREVFCGVIEDLGLSRLKDNRLGFRPPKLSISEKIALTKRRMEESNAFAAQSAQYSSQRLQTGSGAASENHGTPAPVRVFPADKVGHVSVSAGNFQPPTPVVHTPPAVQAPSSVNASTPSPAFSTLTRSAGKDSTSAIPTRSDRAHIRPDGRLNGPTAVPQIPVSSPADRHTARITPVHMQPQPQLPSRINMGANKKAPDQLPARVTSGIHMSAQPAVAQTPKPVVSQTAPGTLPTMHHTVQGLQHAHPPTVNHHVEISQVVQRLLNPKLSQRPIWTPPSRDYMTKAHPCQFCKLVINEVETVVICDACEKAFHLGCLQSHNVKGIPKGEWHCPRCMAMSHGKPFPPKYGRVTRNMNAPKGTSNTSVSHFQSDKKLESVNEKVSQLSTTTNGSLNVRTQSQAINIAEPSYGSNLSHGIDTGRTVMAVGMKKESEPNMGSGPKDRMGAAVDTSQLTSAGSSSNKLPYQIAKSDISYTKDGFIPQTESSTPVVTELNSASKNLPISSNQNNVDQKVSDCDKIPPVLHGDTNGVVGCNQNYNEERRPKDGAKQNLVVTDRVHDHAREVVGTLESELYSVDWIGEIDKLVGEKKFFQSCRINGVVYHVQNYALFRSGTGKLTPFRLQGMWEDTQTNSNWLLVHKCYFPDDLPGDVGRPGAPQINEVYESTHDSSVMAGSVQGPCEVLPFRKFGEDAGISDPTSQGNERTGPVFVRNWFYDESKRAFCPSAS
ncbi:hypothetical protein KSS87_021712 [Heliosperma pusillum]|nr:hypothetical protein KSS87_021712 [Heliosperma pusillum]